MSTTTDTPLLPCPFCGGEPELTKFSGISAYEVECVSPSCRLHVLSNLTETEEEAVRIWNTRIPILQMADSAVERDQIKRKWEADRALLNGAMQLLSKHGIMPSSTELIAASDRAEVKP